MTINNSTIARNSVVGGGGGIDNALTGTLTVSNSTISGNSARDENGGGIDNRGTLTVISSTISGNTSGPGRRGGGIYDRGTLTVSNSTIAGNSAGNGGGGGIYVTGQMNSRNTIIAGNMGAAGPDVFGNIGSRGHNLLGSPQDASGWIETDILHVNPRLEPLRNYGGPTFTHALLPGSPAINRGDNANAPTTDQRGRARIVNGRIDIGAYEAGKPRLPLRADPVFVRPPGLGPGDGNGGADLARMAADVIAAMQGFRRRLPDLVPQV